jgi:hypothetical protein
MSDDEDAADATGDAHPAVGNPAIADGDGAVAARDETVERVRSHARDIARGLAILQGGDYGSETFETDRGTWTVKYEAGALEYLRYAPTAGSDVYVVSTKQPPDPAALAEAMRDYGAFVASYNAYVERLDGVLDDVQGDFPAVASTADVAAERDRVLERITAATDAMAGELHRAEGGNYGTFAARVDGTRWELKWEDGRTSYLRVGGEGGVYLISQYGAPSARDVRAHAEGVAGFVAAFNADIQELGDDLSTVDL